MKRFPTRIVLPLALAAGPCALAQAQTPADPLTEIVVTAERREQNVQDVPASVTAFSGETLRELNVFSTIDLSRFTPGLTIGQNSGDGDFPFISLRGVTLRDFADTNESPSAVYINDFYKANLVGLDGQIFDLQRVEVLRGPQGTLYGRNATGGLIHYVTAAPTRELDGYANFTVGEFNRYALEGAVSGPLSERVSARVSVRRDQWDGWLPNQFASNVDGNAYESTAFRGQLLFEASENAEYSLFLQRGTNENDAGNMFTHFSVRQDPVTGLAVPTPSLPGFGGYVPPAGAPLRSTNSDRDISLDTEQTTAIARGTWRFSGMELVSVTGYEKSRKNATFDSDSTPRIRGTNVYPRAEQFSQELRLSGASEGLRWIGGLYFMDYQVDGTQYRCLPTTCAALRAPVLYALDTQSWAAFANVDYDLTEKLSLTAGLRYTQDKKDYILDNRDARTLFSPATVGDAARRDDGNTGFNARLNWKASENVLVYGGVARAFKAGTFNLGFTAINPAAIPVRPEQLTSYEFGVKSSLADDRVTLNAAVFNYDYKDSQAFQFDGQTLASTAFNRDAEIQGLEAELAWRATQALDLRLIATWLETAALDDVQLPGPTGRGIAPRETRMPLTPEWTLGAIGRYRWTMPAGSSVTLQGGVNYLSSQYFDAFNSPAHFEPSYTLVNARLQWLSADSKWNVALWAENLTDEVFRTYSFDLAFLNFGTSVYGRPRWVGATIGYSF